MAYIGCPAPPSGGAIGSAGGPGRTRRGSLVVRDPDPRRSGLGFLHLHLLVEVLPRSILEGSIRVVGAGQPASAAPASSAAAGHSRRRAVRLVAVRHGGVKGSTWSSSECLPTLARGSISIEKARLAEVATACFVPAPRSAGFDPPATRDPRQRSGSAKRQAAKRQAAKRQAGDRQAGERLRRLAPVLPRRPLLRGDARAPATGGGAGCV